jgi:hypothetical protein
MHKLLEDIIRKELHTQMLANNTWVVRRLLDLEEIKKMKILSKYDPPPDCYIRRIFFLDEGICIF